MVSEPRLMATATGSDVMSQLMSEVEQWRAARHTN